MRFKRVALPHPPQELLETFKQIDSMSKTITIWESAGTYTVASTQVGVDKNGHGQVMHSDIIQRFAGFISSFMGALGKIFYLRESESMQK